MAKADGIRAYFGDQSVQGYAALKKRGDRVVQVMDKAVKLIAGMTRILMAGWSPAGQIAKIGYLRGAICALLFIQQISVAARGGLKKDDAKPEREEERIFYAQLLALHLFGAVSDGVSIATHFQDSQKLEKASEVLGYVADGAATVVDITTIGYSIATWKKADEKGKKERVLDATCAALDILSYGFMGNWLQLKPEIAVKILLGIGGGPSPFTASCALAKHSN